MSQVDFYILHTQTERERERVACRLTEKAWQQGYRIYLYTDSNIHAQLMDDLLWTFKQDSFVPHTIYSSDASCEVAVVIGDTEVFCQNSEVLINLTAHIPSFYHHFKRVVEIVDNTPQAREAGRNRYRSYRDQGNELYSHDV